ncbi:hypothetical protein CYMTET_3804 [Cymbomonas tetramitiformis]|uniref:Thioredoxin-like fold domain-containing protein n=1 Tax=Cymbomonas tetramitiformis TaxID=36881 RepID=A0AAE0H2R4_9CHLO|nr:hypothetical protein CYMTET_3804 [Cymbomonas tetramitiformis]
MPSTTDFLIALTFAAAIFTGSDAQIALPYRQSGQYLIGDSKSTIQIEVFVDLFCGDARLDWLMWKGLKGKLAGENVGLQFHVIVEPFHPWSFTAAVGAQTAAQHGGPDAFFTFAESCWNHGGDFITNWGDQHYPLQSLTEKSVVSELNTFAAAAGVPEDVFYRGMTNRSTAGGMNPWGVARESWKQAVSRGAASSPWYFVNGVPYFAASDSLHPGEQNWVSLINKLLAKQ